jgi:hypothetical protein
MSRSIETTYAPSQKGQTFSSKGGGASRYLLYSRGRRFRPGVTIYVEKDKRHPGFPETLPCPVSPRRASAQPAAIFVIRREC